MTGGLILDLFAGAGGWDEGLRTLGFSALGIESETYACQTGQAAGHTRLQDDVSLLDPSDFSPLWGLIASPPCQAYSRAGKGLGRLDKTHVISCAHEIAAGHDSRIQHLRRCRDPRSLLTVEPLRYAIALRPRWIALEQVPAVLELWTLFAQLLGAHGYHTATGILSSECYGVPQTRKRAFLIAALDGPVSLPAPTHRSYNSRRREVPADELHLQPWVSMAEALGWTADDRVGFPRRGDRHESQGFRSRDRRPAVAPAFALTARARSWTRERQPWVEVRRSGERIHEGFDPASAPSQTVTPKVNRWQARGITQPEADRAEDGPDSDLDWPAQRPAPTLTTTRRSKKGALVGRQLPSGQGQERGGWAWRNGTRAHASLREAEEPAPTIHFGRRANKVEWVPQAGNAARRVRTPSQAQQANGRKGHPENCVGQHRRGAANAVRVTVSQAAILQGFSPDYPWQGTRTKQFEQVGNAVPPPLAHHVLKAALLPSGKRSRRSPRTAKPRQSARRSRSKRKST
jgi:DNA (cytosine-5)-methyltransferase 1